MSNLIWAFVGIAGLVIGAAVVFVYMDRKAKGQPMEWADIGKAVAMAQAALGNIFTEQEVVAVAKFIYHRLNLASDFYTEEQWVDLFKSIFPAKTTRSVEKMSVTLPELAELELFVQSLRSE